MTDRTPSSVKLGARPRLRQIRSNSSADSPCCAAWSAVTPAGWCSRFMMSMSGGHRGGALVFAFGVRRHHRPEQLQAVLAALDLLTGVLGMGHQSKDVAAGADDPGDVVQGAVGIGGIGGPAARIDVSQHDLMITLELVQRGLVGHVA